MAAVVRVPAARRRAGAEPALSAPAGAGARAAELLADHPVHAQQPARRARQRLHPHREREGPAAAARDLQARHAQRARADPHRDRADLRGADGGRGGDGDGVQPPRHRAVGGLLRAAARLPRDPGRGAAGCDDLRSRQPGRRHDVLRRRSAGPVLRAADQTARPPVVPAGMPVAGGRFGHRGPVALLARMVRRRRIVAVGLVLLLVVLGAALLAPQLAPYDPIALDVPARLAAPGHAHPFGTDEFGRDILSRTLYGARLSLAVGALVTALATTAGIAVGLIAGTNRGADRILMRVMDGLMAFPDILLAIALMASLGPSARNVVLALGFVYTPRVARVVRASVLVVASQEYVEAARALGAPVARILLRHILVNTASPVIVQATFITAYAMLGEAALSFLGVGIPPQIPTWGGIISEGQVYLRQAWWISIFPGAAIVLSVLSLNLLGDGLRDYLDPRLRYS